MTRPAAPEPVGPVVVLGGGSAGWMAAAAITTLLPGTPVTLIESEAIGTVGVGEATIPPVRRFNAQLGIDERRFLAGTSGSFKLGIEFVGWGAPSERYFHPFGTHGAEFDTVPMHQFWLQARARGDETPFEDYAYAWALARRGRMEAPSADRRRIQSTFDYAYHFDAGLYAAMLREHAEARGAARVEGEVAQVHQHAESGDVAGLTLTDGRRVDGALFLDCSGFRGLLMEAVGSAYIDWSEHLPCDRALAVACEAGSERRGGDGFTPYTRANARSAGWQWRIPLQHRTGNGYVYCSEHVGDDEAAATLLANLDGAPLAEPRPLRFTTGRRAEFWRRNVVALGLAAGFMEPLESTSLHLVQSGLARLIALWPEARIDPLRREEFNRLTADEYAHIRDFLVLHYKANRREEPFWRARREADVPDGLRYRMDQWQASGRLVAHGIELFQNASWLAVYLGQGVMPRAYDPAADARPVDGAARLAGLIRVGNEAAEAARPHGEVVAQLGPAPRLAA